MPGCVVNNFAVTNFNICICATEYALSAINICVPSSHTLTGCITCSSQTVCTSCDMGSNFITDPSSSSECAYNPGFYLSTNICIDCLTTGRIGCTKCNSATVCTVCDSSRDFVLIGASCQCISGYYPFGTTCLLCYGFIGCITCSDALTCTLCNTTEFFQINMGTCICIDGYFIYRG
jgi:hypothetical protein